MTNYSTIKALEERYMVHIDRDTFWNPLTLTDGEDFKIYTLDGCCWDKVIGYRSLVHTLATDKENLLKIGKEYKAKHPDIKEEDEDDFE